MAGRTESIKGTTSPDFQFGRRGPRLFQGTADPNSASPGGPPEVDGDLYVRTLTGSEGLWQFKNSAWVRLAGSLIRSQTIGTGATQNIDVVLPAGARVQSVKLDVTTPYSGGATILIQDDGPTVYMTTSENIPQRSALFKSLQPGHVVAGGTRQLQAIIGGAPGAGAAEVIVEYKV